MLILLTVHSSLFNCVFARCGCGGNGGSSVCVEAEQSPVSVLLMISMVKQERKKWQN